MNTAEKGFFDLGATLSLSVSLHLERSFGEVFARARELNFDRFFKIMMKSDFLMVRLEPFSQLLDLLVVTVEFGGWMRPPKVASIRRETFWGQCFEQFE